MVFLLFEKGFCGSVKIYGRWSLTKRRIKNKKNESKKTSVSVYITVQKLGFDLMFLCSPRLVSFDPVRIITM